jgi:hypothetical protein
MNQPIYSANTIRHFNAVPAAPVELFPDSIQAALDRLEKIAKGAKPGEVRPSPENVEWAKKVLLRVLPRYYLLGAEIDAFQREIHVNWEHGNKRVTVFLPEPNMVKIYCEEQGNGDNVEHHRRDGNDPWIISGVLRWMFQ